MSPKPRELHLLRHAKSSWDDPTLADHDRPLAPRGRRASGAIAEYLRRERITPELVLCSSSARTCETLALVSAGFDDSSEVRVETERGLYAVSAGDLLARLRRVPGEVGAVMLINHQPAIQGLALDLAGPGSDGAALERMRGKFPTAALATFSFPGPWSGLTSGSARLGAFVTPKRLGSSRG